MTVTLPGPARHGRPIDPAGRRRSSRVPGFYTRADVEADLGLTTTERDTFERAGILGPRERRERGDTRPLLYSGADLALARIAMSAHRFGIRGEALRRLVDAVRLKHRRLAPGWSGLVVIDPDGDVELIADGRDVGADLASRGDLTALLLLRVQVPDLPEHAS